jgi:hypothetical protein
VTRVSYEGVPVNPHVEIVALADDAWRLADDRIDASDPRRIIGYVERSESGFEVLWMTPTAGPRDDFGCLAEALAAASQRMPADAEPTTID